MKGLQQVAVFVSFLVSYDVASSEKTTTTTRLGAATKSPSSVGGSTCCPPPAPMAPNFKCADGSTGGPFCSKQCSWSYRNCPTTPAPTTESSLGGVSKGTTALPSADCAVMADLLMGNGSSQLEEHNPICASGSGSCDLQIVMGYYTTCSATCGKIGARCDAAWKAGIWCQVGGEASCDDPMYSMICRCAPAPPVTIDPSVPKKRCAQVMCNNKTCADWNSRGVDAAGVFPNCSECRSCVDCNWWSCGSGD
eukprot:INCI9414.3.p1 GENE.INCI9414.3~~INCI9414.3.p1  ORF type:complete len:251 (-),score=34.22 INCI9414.3:1792-2544(-)